GREIGFVRGTRGPRPAGPGPPTGRIAVGRRGRGAGRVGCGVRGWTSWARSRGVAGVDRSAPSIPHHRGSGSRRFTEFRTGPARGAVPRRAGRGREPTAGVRDTESRCLSPTMLFILSHSLPPAPSPATPSAVNSRMLNAGSRFGYRLGPRGRT